MNVILPGFFHSGKITTDLVFAAAAYAHRQNNERYVKEDDCIRQDASENTESVKKTSNRTYAFRALEDPSIITDEDHQFGAKVYEYFKGKLTLKIISDQLNSFEKHVWDIIQVDNWKNMRNPVHHFAVATSLPASYTRDKQRMDAEQAINNATKQHIGHIKQRLTLNITVLNSVFSHKWNVCYITALTEDNHIVYFPFKNRIKANTSLNITGTVKAHRDNFQTSAEPSKNQ